MYLAKQSFPPDLPGLVLVIVWSRAQKLVTYAILLFKVTIEI